VTRAVAADDGTTRRVTDRTSADDDKVAADPAVTDVAAGLNEAMYAPPPSCCSPSNPCTATS
jgi:hypothetical protein